MLLKLEHSLPADFFNTFLYAPVKSFSGSYQAPDKNPPNFSLLIKLKSFMVSDEQAGPQMLHISNFAF